MDRPRYLAWSVERVERCQRASRAVAILEPKSAVDTTPGDRRRTLAVALCPGEAQFLMHELRREPTGWTSGLELVERLATELGGKLSGIYLRAYAPEVARTTIEIEANGRAVEIPVEPGLALAASVRLGIPLYVDQALVDPELAVEPSPQLSGALAEFLATLPLDDL